MSAMLALVIGLLGFQSPPSKTAGDEDVRISAGSEIRHRLEAGESWRADFTADHDGPVTICAESEDFDTVLIVERSGHRIDLPSDAGIDGDEWAVIELRKGDRAELVLSAADGNEGELLLRVCDGAEPAPQGDDRWKRTAERLDRRALRVSERGDAIGAALALERLYELHLQGNALLAARDDARRFLEAAQGCPAGLHARALAARGRIESQFYESGNAAPVFEQALAIGGKDLPATTIRELHEELGLAWCATGRVQDGRRELDHAVELARAENSPDVLAPMLSRYGSALILHGYIEEARAKLDEAGRLLPEMKRGEGRAFVLGNQALLLQVCGRFREALEIYERAIQQGPSLTLRMEQLGSLALVHCKLDLLDQARVDLEEAERIAVSLGVDGLRAKHLHLSGSILWRQGHAEEARKDLEEALAVAEKRGDTDDVCEILVTLGGVHEARGDLPQQRTCFEKLRSIAEHDQDDRLMGRALRGLGANLVNSKDLAEGVDLLRKSGDLASRYSDTELEADAVGTLAWAEYLLGTQGGLDQRHLDEAIEDARRAVAAYDDGGSKLQALEVLDTVASAAIAEGRVQEARDAITSAFRRLEESVVEEEEGARSQLETILTSFAEHAYDVAALEIAQAPVAERARVTELAWRSANAWQSRSLLRALVHNRQKSGTPSEHALRAELESARADWLRILAEKSERVRGHSGPAEIGDLLEASARARTRYEDLRSNLVEALTTSLSDALRQPSLSEIQAALGDRNVGLIEYATGAERLYAFVVTDKGMTQFDLGSRAEINPVAQGFVDDLRSDPSVGRSRPGDQSLASGAELESRILEPILRELPESVRTLVVVPGGSLCALSFDALPIKSTNSGSTFLIERYAVAYSPSSASLVALADRPARTGPENTLILADARYVDAGEGATRSMPIDLRNSRPIFPRLRQTREEACAIAKVLAEGRGHGSTELAATIQRWRAGGDGWSAESWSSNGIELHLGANATREVLLDRAPNASLLHLAAHGFADPTDADGSGLALSWEESSRGLLMYEDVLGLHLDANLAVLSACDTGLGAVFPRHGPLSLARAFLQAGSRAVVASLWEADDRVARELMERFYSEHIAHGRSAFTALREAKLEVLRGTPRLNAPGPERGSGLGSGAARWSASIRGAHEWAAFVYFGLPR